MDQRLPSAAPAGTWLGRYLDARPISANGAFRVVCCRRMHSAQRVVVTIADPAADAAAARAALRRLHQAHSSVAHAALAPAVELVEDGATPHVVFDVPAQLDLHSLVRLADGQLKHSVPHAQADALVYTLRRALGEAARRCVALGGPLHLGVICYRNVLFAPDGRFWLLGLGHNVAACDEHGDVSARSVFAAPEVLLGGAASPMGDYIALMHFGRSLMGFMDMAPVLQRIVKGDGPASHAELYELLRWIQAEVLGVAPAQRPSVEEAVEVSWKIRELLNCEPDLEGFQRTAAAAIARVGDCTESEGGWHTWRVAQDGSWLASADKRIELRSRPMRQIFSELLAVHEQRPGARLSVHELFEVGWPGQRIGKRAGANRVYVAINGLRRRGLGDDLESDGGYRLSPTIKWVREPA